MKFLLGILVSLNAFASGFTGNFKALEILPEDRRPLYELDVSYKISVKGDEIFEPQLTGNFEIDGGFSPNQFHLHFFQSPQTDLLVIATDLKSKVTSIVESITGPGIKNLVYEATVVVVDQEKVNQSLEEAIIIERSEVRLDKTLTQLPLLIKLCIAQPRRFGPQLRQIGCEDLSREEIRNGKITLKEINLSRIKPDRELHYFFHWSIEGLRLNGQIKRTPMVKVSP